MKYKIQFKYEMQCGEWDDLLKDEYYEGQGAEPIVGTHETMTEYDSIEKANAQVEIEKEDYRDAYDHHSAEDIEDMMPEYRVVPSHLQPDTVETVTRIEDIYADGSVNMKHYYLHSDWSVFSCEKPIEEDSHDDMSVRFEFSDSQEANDYISDPMDFAFSNDLVTFRSGCIEECTREEIIKGSKEAIQ